MCSPDGHQGATEYIFMFSKDKNNLYLEPIYQYTKLSDHIKNYLNEGKSWKYTTVLKNVSGKELIYVDKDKEMYFYGYKNIETTSVSLFAKDLNITEEEVYNTYANKIFRTTNAQSSVRQTVIQKTKGHSYALYGCKYKPIKGRNQNSEIEVLYKPSSDLEQRNMVMFLSDVLEKVDDEFFYTNKIGDLWDDIDYNNLTKEGNTEFSNGKKPIKLIQRMITMLTTSTSKDVVLDFFAGSSSTAHAVLQLNAEDGGNRKFIMVQLPEVVDEKHEAFKAGYKTIAEISKERIRRAGRQILDGECHENWNKDVGFRVLKVDSTNMKDIYYHPSEVVQEDFENQINPIKPDRSNEDLLFQVMLDLGLELTLPIRSETMYGKTVFFVDENSLIACFDLNIPEELVFDLTRQNPVRVVFADKCFNNNDSLKVNVKQIFKQQSPDTVVMSFF